jgi:hypothetical protein
MPPFRHWRRRARSLASLAALVSPIGPPHGVECDGEDLTTGDLADDEIPAGQALPWGVRLTGGVPVDLGPTCLPLCARVGALHQVYPVFSVANF